MSRLLGLDNYLFFWLQLTSLLLCSGTRASPSGLIVRNDCQTVTVVSGDSCGALASKCTISPQQFTDYNKDPELCSKLTPGQKVCCSAGTLPDIRPQTHPDGSCASYVVKTGDTCSAIASANGLSIVALHYFNDMVTWAWSGCDHLAANMTICLSKGIPPMPGPMANAVCGPQKPGTKTPSDGERITNMNPCPLNACCTVWGQCGTTPEFCTVDPGITGNPGSAAPGANSCISNCGTNVTNNEGQPLFDISIAYYESWNYDRNCLNMRADSVDTTKYTHLHWGFATVSETFEVSINDTYNQWSRFKALDIHRVISLGGWGFSTSSTTYDILRKAMEPANVTKFVDSIVSFLEDNDLDGVDIDWEYPGAPDIPGIPSGQLSDGSNYMAFLGLLRNTLPKFKSLSIATPASYWYLKEFPIADMHQYLDYIVYMTYDLHGQWDYGNSYTQDGCKNGSCLRSHVNLTETNYALAMITKAGVPASKIVVGMSSYGRGFGMTQKGCTDPTCHFQGPKSTALPGFCTNTAGMLSNAEINLIVAAQENGTSYWYDTDSNSNILVYQDDQWVSYMDDTPKASRAAYYRGLGFLGTVDWAVDLQEFQSDDDGNPNDDDDDAGLPVAPPMPACTATYQTMDELDAAADSIPPDCKGIYTVMTLSNVLNAAVNSYKDMMHDGYDKKFKVYSKAVAGSASKSVGDFMNMSGDEYFSCTVTEEAMCCEHCKSQQGLNPCAYCFDGECYHMVQRREPFISGPSAYDITSRDGLPPPSREPVSRMVNESEPCPPNFSKRGFSSDDGHEQSVYWTLKPDKANQFYADLLSNTGIAKDKIKWGNHHRGNDCAPSAKPDDDCWGLGMDFNFPKPHGYEASDVTNPKDVVQRALNNSDNLQQQLNDVVTTLKFSAYQADAYELIDAISVPVLLIADAVENMATVDEVAHHIEEEKKKAMILAFISAILFFIPIAGEVVGSVAELSSLASILAVLSAAGDTALGVYTVVDNPKNPLLGIIGIVLAPLALMSVTRISEAANLRRGMSDADILKLGGKVGTRTQTIKKVIGTCHKAL